MMSMGEGVSNVLGFHSNTLYTIHGDGHERVGNISFTPINEKLGVDYVFIYGYHTAKQFWKSIS